MEIPHISDELLSYLAKMFPDRCPKKGTPLEDIMYNAGQASVVRHLREARERHFEQQLGPIR